PSGWPPRARCARWPAACTGSVGTPSKGDLHETSPGPPPRRGDRGLADPPGARGRPNASRSQQGHHPPDLLPTPRPVEDARRDQRAAPEEPLLREVPPEGCG